MGETLNETQIWNLALYVAEQRQGTTILDKRSGMALTIPTGRMASERESFRVETVAEGLDPMPFSIALLPDWRILLSERMRGLSIIGRHTDRCSDCNDLSRRSKRPVSMNRLVRGRIRGMAWVDQEILWQADPETYTDTSDLAAGGRIAFDDSGHVYFSVGMKAPLDYMGIQDLTLPHGKIHRLEDDGRIPPDNLFVKTTAALKSIWTCGHRSVQGLEFNTQTRDLWSTEMGPRGGDEVNRLLPGGNYGWPVFTNGVNYDGRPVNGARLLNSNLESKDTLFPVLDMTPSQGISSFVFYRGKEFRNWQNNIIVGTLRATDLLRMEVVENQVMRTEILLKDLARFRDIALGPEGEIYLLLENAGGCGSSAWLPIRRARCFVPNERQHCGGCLARFLGVWGQPPIPNSPDCLGYGANLWAKGLGAACLRLVWFLVSASASLRWSGGMRVASRSRLIAPAEYPSTPARWNQ